MSGPEPWWKKVIKWSPSRAKTKFYWKKKGPLEKQNDLAKRWASGFKSFWRGLWKLPPCFKCCSDRLLMWKVDGLSQNKRVCKVFRNWVDAMSKQITKRGNRSHWSILKCWNDIESIMMLRNNIETESGILETAKLYLIINFLRETHIWKYHLSAEEKIK